MSTTQNAEHPAVPTLEIRGAAPIPQLGYGVFKVDPDIAADVTAQALAAGAVVDHHHAVGLAWQALRQRRRGDPAAQVRAQHSDRSCHAAAPIRAR